MDSGRRVIVGVDGSVGSLRALRRAVAEARLRDAVVYSVFAWVPPGGEGMNRRVPCPPSLTRAWRDDATQRLTTAWEEALGGVPSDLEVWLLAVRGRAGDVLVGLADRPDDLLVVGAGRRGVLRRMVSGSVTRYCVARAGCGVLAVPPSPLEREVQHTFARRRILRELTDHLDR